MNQEANLSEWTLINDSVVERMGSWFNVIRQCVELRIFPKIIFFEKLNSEDDDLIKDSEPLTEGFLQFLYTLSIKAS
jgi:hypothetical protein